MGLGSKMVVSGDTTQVDLPTHRRQRVDRRRASAQRHRRILPEALNNEDIVRHRLVQDIVRAYEEEGPKRRH